MQIEKPNDVLDLYTTMTTCPRRFAKRLKWRPDDGSKVGALPNGFRHRLLTEINNSPIDNDLPVINGCEKIKFQSPQNFSSPSLMNIFPCVPSELGCRSFNRTLECKQLGDPVTGLRVG